MEHRAEKRADLKGYCQFNKGVLLGPGKEGVQIKTEF